MAYLQPILVKRGELLLDFDFINNWDSDLKEMDKDIIGETFHSPTTFLLFLLGYAKAYFHLPYRQTEEGIAQGHAKGWQYYKVLQPLVIDICCIFFISMVLRNSDKITL